ncbi:MAG: hypothetical protein CM15mP111_3350 [Hyphomicrobiales bacterium]|nr:MAG: hypothetical protein CM15mP111_3350 [Hyphomicrobiales bacterium]
MQVLTLLHGHQVKTQTISLLSGGEQALTVIALILAVFLENPAPVCILDELTRH